MKKTLLRALPMLFVGLLFALQSMHAQTYYVDAVNGIDTDPGTQANPKKTIQSAINVASGASTIYILAGTYNENVVIDKDNISLMGAGSGANGNGVPTSLNPAIHTVITGATGRGVQISGARINVTVRDLAIVGFDREGFYAPANANNLTVQNLQVNGNCTGNGRGGIFIDGGITNVTITGCAVQNNGTVTSTSTPRGIGIWNGSKDDITITNNYVVFTSCCGIDLNDGTSSGVNISDNEIIAGASNSDSGIGVLGMKAGNGPNIIANNSITVAKRYGIEIKNPAGSGIDDELADGAIIVKGNEITRVDNSPAVIGTEARDLAGIAVFRRSFTSGNPSGYIDVPSGVVIKNNTISGFQQPGAGEGYGVVVEGVRMTVKDNNINNCDVGIQRQSGNSSNYVKNNAGDANQEVVGNDTYFNRGNSPFSSALVIGTNTYSGNGVNTRDEFAANTYFGNAQFVYNSTQKINYATIGLAVEYAAVGNTLELSENTFDERVVINKSLTIDGIDKTKSNVTYTGTAITTSGNGIPTLFTIAATNVTIKNISFTVDLVKIHSAIHSYGNVSGIVITDNNFTASASGSLSGLPTKIGYSRRNAVSINIDAYDSDYNNISTGITGVTIQRNTVNGLIGGDAANGGFRGGFQVDRAKDVLIGGDTPADGNVAQTINHDVISRFFVDGDVTVKNNALNGGGLEMSSTNNANGTVTIESNTFNGLASNTYTSQARFQGNTNNKAFVLKNNTFSNTKWGLSLENFRNIAVEGNNFTPSTDDFRLITVNTKMLLSIDNGVPFPTSLNIISNTFNGHGAATQGKAIAFYNHKAEATNNYLAGNITLGGVGSNNIFNANIPTYIYVDNNDGNLTKTGAGTGPDPFVALAGHPEYGSNIAVTTTGYWTKDIRADQNQFYVDGTLRTPFSLSSSQMTELDGKIFDKKDNANIGQVQYYFPVTNVTTGINYATIQGAVDAATTGDEIEVLAGVYAEKVTVNKQLTIKGPNAGIEGKSGSRIAEAKIIPPTTDIGTSAGVMVTFGAGSAGGVFDGFEVNGDNPALTSGTISGGIDVDASYGIGIEDAGNVIVKNNIVQNFGGSAAAPQSLGIYVAPNTNAVYSGVVIEKNYVKNIYQSAASAALVGIYAYSNAYSQIKDNKVENVRTGIQFDNPNQANPNAATFEAAIDNNEIIASRGVYYNLAYNTASPWYVRNNVISSAPLVAPSTTFIGIRVESIQGAYSGYITDNTIDGRYSARIAEDAAFVGTGIWFNNKVNTTGTLLFKNNDIANVTDGIVYNATGTETLTTNVRFVGGDIHDIQRDYVRYIIPSGTPTFADVNLPSTKLDGKTGEEWNTELGDLTSIYAKITDKDEDANFGKVNLLFPIKNINQETAYTTLQEAASDVLNVDADIISIKNDAGVYGNLGDVTFTKTNTIAVEGNTSAVLSFGNFTANGVGKEITFNNPVNVVGNFTLTAGKIIPSVSFILNAAVTTTPGIGNFIDGQVAVNNVNSDVLIPIGKDGKAAYIELTGTSGASSTFTAEYFPAAHTSSAKGTGLTSVSGNEYWSLNRTSGDLSAKVKLYTFDLVASGLPLGTLGDAVVAQYIGGQWEAQGQGSLSVASPYHVAAGITSSTFGEFTFGSTTTVLPIELLSFTANVTTGGALVKWSTAKEENNAKFEIEKSFDGKNFFVIDSRKGQGNSSTISNYEFLDVSFKQSAYYRLVQVDAGGKRNVYDDLTKFVKGLDNSLSVVAYPNPVATKLYVTVGSANKENVKLLLSDLTGKTLKVKTADSSQPIELDVAGIATGSYILQVIKDSGNVSKKILKL